MKPKYAIYGLTACTIILMICTSISSDRFSKCIKELEIVKKERDIYKHSLSVRDAQFDSMEKSANECLQQAQRVIRQYNEAIELTKRYRNLLLDLQGVVRESLKH